MLSVSHALSFIIPNNSVRPIVCVITAILTMRKEKKNNLESIFQILSNWGWNWDSNPGPRTLNHQVHLPVWEWGSV